MASATLAIPSIVSAIFSSSFSFLFLPCVFFIIVSYLLTLIICSSSPYFLALIPYDFSLFLLLIFCSFFFLLVFVYCFLLLNLLLLEAFMSFCGAICTALVFMAAGLGCLGAKGGCTPACSGLRAASGCPVQLY